MEQAINMAELLGDLDFDPVALKAKYLQERDKRIREDGNEQYVEVTAEFSHYIDDPYVDPGFTREPLHDEVEVAIIGGGFGGLLMAARLREAGFEDIRMIERAGDFGGTWYWNRYPGAMCDVESYCYLPLLEELDYMPKHKYSFAPEILEHSKRIARHYNLYENACLQTSITQLSWDAQENCWIIETIATTACAHAMWPWRTVRKPTKTARHSRHQRLQRTYLPYQSLGLQLHRR